MDDAALQSLPSDAPRIDGSALLAGAAADPEIADADDGLIDLADDADDADAPDDAEGDPDEIDADESDDADDPVARREAELAEREARIAEAERAQRQAESEQYWSSKWDEGKTYYDRASRWIYDAAREQYDPVAFVEEKFAALNQWRDDYQAQFHRAQQAALWSYAAEQAKPQYARQVLAHYGLPEDDLPRLLKKSPEQMAEYAADLRDLRRAQKQAVAAQKLPKAKPGTGKAASSRVRAGSDEHLAALLRR